MSDSKAIETPGRVDLSDLRLMPAWVGGIGKEAPAQKYRDYEERGPSRGGDRGGERGRGKPFGERGARPGGDKFGGRGGDRGDRGDRRGAAPTYEPREPIPNDIAVTVEAEEKATDALAAHIRATGRAFSMFDASRLVLESGDRFHVKFQCAPERPTGLFRIEATGGLYLSREEALKHALSSGALDHFYRMEEIELEEPKGEFKSIGACGMSGYLFGPPSHHSYQTSIIRHHREQFSNMALEDYKRRVRVESDPEVVAKWKEQQRKGTRWIYLKGEVAEGQEPLTFNTRSEMESHFRRHHAETSIAEVREARVPGQGKTSDLSSPLLVLLRRAVDFGRNHLFEFSQRLGGELERRGLKLFKRRSGKLFVSRVKPRAVDPGVIFSERIKSIVEAVRHLPGISISKLVEAVAITPEGAEATQSSETPASEPGQLTDAQIAVMKDLRWLADEGYVIEYSDNAVFLGVQGETPSTPKPTKAKTAKVEVPISEKPVHESGAESAAAAAPISEPEPKIKVDTAPEATTCDGETIATPPAPEEAAQVEELTLSEPATTEVSEPVSPEEPASETSRDSAT